MIRLPRVAAVAAVVACMVQSRARAQVVEQIPSDSSGFFEVKNLQSLSDKVAKYAKSLGIDQFVPQFADPLKSMEEQFGATKGVDAQGDMAVAFFAPKNAGHGQAGRQNGAEGGNAAAAAPGHSSDEPGVLAFVPVSDYAAFLGNFQDVHEAGGNGVSQVTVPKDKEKLFVAHRGKYAVAAMDKSLLNKHGGLKLEAGATREIGEKDAVMFVDVASLRPVMQQGVDEFKKQMEQMKNNPNGPGGGPNPFANNAQMQQMMDAYVNGAQQVVHDTRWATISFNMTDNGIGLGGEAAFDPQSDLGRTVAQVQNTDRPMTAGLPKANYFMFGGLVMSPALADKFFSTFMQPLEKQAAHNDNAHADELKTALDAARTGLRSIKDASFGYAGSEAPNAGLVEFVEVAHGDAQTILKSQKAALPAMSDMMGLNGGAMKASAKVSAGEPKEIDGVSLQTYTIKFNFDAHDPQGAQAQQVMSMMFGHNGMQGAVGAVNDNTFVSMIGGDDKFQSSAIAAAKAGTNPFDQAANVKLVTQQLPRQRAFEAYFAIDNVVNAALRFARQQGMAVQFKLPPNLPPIGMSAGTEGASARFDLVIPNQLVQSMTAAVMQLQMQMQGGPGGQGAGGGGGI